MKLLNGLCKKKFKNAYLVRPLKSTMLYPLMCLVITNMIEPNEHL